MAEFNPGSIFARLSSLLIIPFTILRHMASSSSTQQDSEGATGLDYGPNANLPGPSPVNPNLVVSDDIRAFRTTLSFLEHLQTKEMEKLPDRTYGNSPRMIKNSSFTPLWPWYQCGISMWLQWGPMLGYGHSGSPPCREPCLRISS